MPTDAEILGKVREIVDRAFEYASPRLSEDDVAELLVILGMGPTDDDLAYLEGGLR
jgi:hypothetical protein